MLDAENDDDCARVPVSRPVPRVAPKREEPPAEHTNIFERAVGDSVNLESDIMMRYVTQAVKNRGGS